MTITLIQTPHYHYLQFSIWPLFNTNSNTSKNSFLPNAPNGLVLSHVTQNNFFTKSQYYFAPHNASNANNNNNNHGNDDFDNTSYFSSNLANNQTTYDLNSSFNNNNNNNNDNDYNHNEYDNATTSLSASNMPSIPTTAIPSSCQSVAMLTLVKLINNKCKFYMDIIEEAWFLDISQHPSIQNIVEMGLTVEKLKEFHDIKLFFTISNLSAKSNKLCEDFLNGLINYKKTSQRFLPLGTSRNLSQMLGTQRNVRNMQNSSIDDEEYDSSQLCDDYE